MTQDAESIYNEYMSKLKQVMPNVDPGLVHQIIYLERKLTNEDMNEPDVSAIIEYKSGIDVDVKMNGLREKYSLEVEHGDKQGVLHVMGRMKIGDIQKIAADMDIVKITGKADPTYGE
ncbi:hypothetical protein DYY67_0947 [Candidatus Nitrosotalea sp. TS]|uniref:hypothetical protein n=1 Tax=Candidatus Nitrosotalea sp. TS TaxID=2341020 RepID=UPI0014096ABB|nr:hypothetical protein [Candidatus Nitrosotalea sp. TS]NHI03877.1 hypothetical protein [Candidatus Nitrosotalea sp. TS]